MNEVLREFKFTKSFFDDCLIFGNKDEHFSQVEVLKKFAELGIHVNMSKCQFMKPEVNFIGLTITNAGIRPNANKLQELVEFNKPLIYLKAFKDIVNKRFRWVEYLECQYRYSLYTR